MILFISEESFAQTGGFAGEFTRIGFGPRGMAMGNAMVAVADEGSYAYYNPAIAAKPAVDGIQLDISTSIMEFDRQLHNINAQFNLSPTASLSIGLINARVTNIDGRTQSGFHTESLSTDEFQVLSNFGLRFSEKVWGGFGLKINFANFDENVSTSTSIGIDGGIYAVVLDGLTIGFAIQDLLASYRTDSSGLFGDNSRNRDQNFPTRFKFGAAYRPISKLLFSSEYEIRTQESEINRSVVQLFNGIPTTVTQREDVTTSSQFLRFGSRYLLHERLTVRSGLQFIDLDYNTETTFSAGFSLHLPFDRFQPSVDYAFYREPNSISNIHVFALRLHL
ncbi:MAG: hypothetical protein ACFCU6_02660 [Balneolaceae bacterium]